MCLEDILIAITSELTTPLTYQWDCAKNMFNILNDLSSKKFNETEFALTENKFLVDIIKLV